MPFGDGTGPLGQGRGQARNRGRRRMRKRGGSNTGPGGICVCPNCGVEAPHQLRMPCSSVNCPECGTKMIRK